MKRNILLICITSVGLFNNIKLSVVENPIEIIELPANIKYNSPVTYFAIYDI